MRFRLFALFFSISLGLFSSSDYQVGAQTPETARIAFTSWRDGTEEIYTMNPDGSNQVNLTRHFSPALLNREPVWSPTGERILFVSNRDGTLDLYLMDVDGQNVKRVFEKVRHRQHPAWAS